MTFCPSWLAVAVWVLRVGPLPHFVYFLQETARNATEEQIGQFNLKDSIRNSTKEPEIRL